MDKHFEGRLVRAFINIMPAVLEEKARWDSLDSLPLAVAA
jgi:hypothetical protein